MSKDGKSPAPPGSFVELNLDLIAEGKFRRDFEKKLRRALREQKVYEEETGDMTSTVSVTATLTIKRAKGTRDHFEVVHGVVSKTPTSKELSIVKERGGKLLCQPVGASGIDPDQMAFYDADGRIIGGVDPETGEVVEHHGAGEAPSIAGKIEKQA